MAQSRKARKALATAPAKSDARRQVFSKTCQCRKPTVQSAVHFGMFCLACWHPVLSPKVKRGR